MTQRLTEFMKIPQDDVKKKREEFMVSLRRKQKQALFNSCRQIHLPPSAYALFSDAYFEDLDLLSIARDTQHTEKCTQLATLICTATTGNVIVV